MNSLVRKLGITRATTAALGLLLAGWSTLLYAENIKVYLSGKDEVPPVNTAASGGGTLSIVPNKTLSGSIRTSGVAATMAHIHLGAPGENGPVVVKLNKAADNVWTIPEDAKLTDEAYKAFEAGKLYVNVHSEAHPAGELRGQLEIPTWMKDQPKNVRSGGGGY